MSSLYYCKYTCPAVDGEIKSLTSDVFKILNDIDVPLDIIALVESTVEASCERMKEVGTYLLREALDKATADLSDAEERVSDLKKESDANEATISQLHDEIYHLNQQLSYM